MLLPTRGAGKEPAGAGRPSCGRLDNPFDKIAQFLELCG